MGLRWLARFKLIRLRRISLATFAAFGGAHNESAEGWAEGWMPIYVLSASGRGFAFAKQGDYCLPPAGFLHSQNKVIKCAVGAIMNGWVGGFAKVDNVFLRLGGFAKVDNRFGLILSLQGGCIGWFH